MRTDNSSQEVTIQRIRRDDLSAVLAIEQEVQIAPWTEGMFADCLDAANYECWLLRCDSEIVGFVIFSLQVGECHILNLCVKRREQRKGYGRRLLSQALTVAQEDHADMVFLEVRCSNQTAIALYRAGGFNEVGTRKGYYMTATGSEDAIIFAMDLRARDKSC